jgi:hypothetical protein
MFANNNSFLHLAKKLHIVDYVGKHKLDFVAISEAGRRDFLVSLLKCLFIGVDFTWTFHLPCGRSQGLLLSIRLDTMNVGLFEWRLSYKNSYPQ